VFKLAKTAFKGVVLLFAAYAFAFVPLGSRTALQHLRAVLATPEAQDAGRELKAAGGRVVNELVNPAPTQGRPELPVLAPPQSKVELEPGDLPPLRSLDASVPGTHSTP